MEKTSLLSAYWTLAVLFVVNVFSFVDRAVFTQLLVRIKPDLGLSDIQVGLIGGTAFSMAYMIVTIPVSVFVEFLPSRRLFLFGAILIWSCFSAASCVKRFAFLFLCRMGVGLGEAVLSPTAYGLLSELFSVGKRGLALGVFITASFLGVGLSFFISSVVLAQTSRAPLGLQVCDSLSTLCCSNWKVIRSRGSFVSSFSAWPVCAAHFFFSPSRSLDKQPREVRPTWASCSLP